ncbi:integrase arm-type DNA-binding domain-containing protein [Shewanella sp. T24-MNA-CIBAN-0130]|uniref:tyrosine-type recombinase/integrase n=1 Tax=Shewanella sp. T24-MNA-CIBAN-0130 TaxID=3140470 RepID=UPI00332D8A50
MSLNDSWLRANTGKVPEKIFEKADRDGLSVRVTKKGVIIFQMRYKLNGKAARIDIGPYPIASLKDARDTCNKYRRWLLDDIDPRDALREKKQTEDASTIEAMFRSWHNSQFVDGRSSVKNKTANDYIKSLELHVFPKIGSKIVSKVTLHQWLDLLEPLAAKKPTMANLVLTVSRRALKWAVRRRLIQTNELAGIESKEDLNITSKSRTRVLSNDELTSFLQALDGAKRQKLGNRLMLFLAVFFGCRIGELRLSEYQHFDFDKMVWTVPIENHKMGSKTDKPLKRPIIPEIVPIIELAMSLGKPVSKKYVFPTKTGGPYDNSVATRMLSPINTWLKANEKQVEHFTVHDLRRTQRTNMSKIATTDVAETMLGHKLPGIQSIYDHHDYLEEQAKAYKIWWNKLQRLKDPDAYQNVVELKKAQ